MSIQEFSGYLDRYSYHIDDFFMISFIFFTLIILVYYIRRRYHLHLEIKAITTEQLWFRNFQNHLKNLRIKAMITNFVMIILFVELGMRVCYIIKDRCSIASLFKLNFTCPHFGLVYTMYSPLEIVTRSSYIPLLCLFVKVLWLVYLHSPYKYSVIKWVGYIVMKIIAVQTYTYIPPIIGEMYGYTENGTEKHEIAFILYPLEWFCMVFEYVYYLLYSRRFYLLLKGIELENKLSLDRKKYLESKFVRVHFKVCTILVAITFLFRIVSCMPPFRFFAIEYLLELFTNRPELIDGIGRSFAGGFFLLFYRIVSNLNYLYMFIVISLQYYKKRNNRNINDRIRPIVRAYQDKIFTSRVNYTRR